MSFQDKPRSPHPFMGGSMSHVRKIDMAGVCPIGTKECGDMEGIPHTYLIVNGLAGECLLDQTILMCHQLVYYPKC